VRAVGGTAPIGADGRPQVWNGQLGWFDRDERRDMSGGESGNRFTDWGESALAGDG
jgi:hypothetical protein